LKIKPICKSVTACENENIDFLGFCKLSVPFEAAGLVKMRYYGYLWPKLLSPMKISLLLILSFGFLLPVSQAQNPDTLVLIRLKLNVPIPTDQSFTFSIPIMGGLLPDLYEVMDVDVDIDIDHENINDLVVTVWAPLNRKVVLFQALYCLNIPLPMQNTKATFNDEAYNINVYNSTGQKVPAHITCAASEPLLGAFNQGQMMPQWDLLSVFDGDILPAQKDCGKSPEFIVASNQINTTDSRFSSASVADFIEEMTLNPGDQIVLRYHPQGNASALDGMKNGYVYVMQVIDFETVELLAANGVNLTGGTPNGLHRFSFHKDWIVMVHDRSPGFGGSINAVGLRISLEEKLCKKFGLGPVGQSESRNSAQQRESEITEVTTTYSPNPFNTYLVLNNDYPDQQFLRVFSADGSVVYGPVKFTGSVELDTHQWSPGIYYAETRTPETVTQTMLVKQ
jgi:hypothetical protein